MAHWFVRAKSPKRRKVPKESTQGFLRSGKRDIRREMRERMSERKKIAIRAQGRGFAKKLAKQRDAGGFLSKEKPCLYGNCKIS